jgi:hypothetical protein
LGNQRKPQQKAGYKAAADFFTTRCGFVLIAGRHPYKPYDEDRRAQINAAVQTLRCRALDADQAALRAKHAGHAEVLGRLKRARVTPL